MGKLHLALIYDWGPEEVVIDKTADAALVQEVAGYFLQEAERAKETLKEF